MKFKVITWAQCVKWHLNTSYLLQALILKLKDPDPNPGVVISVLATIGELAQVRLASCGQCHIILIFLPSKSEQNLLCFAYDFIFGITHIFSQAAWACPFLRESRAPSMDVCLAPPCPGGSMVWAEESRKPSYRVHTERRRSSGRPSVQGLLSAGGDRSPAAQEPAQQGTRKCRKYNKRYISLENKIYIKL